MQNKKEILSDLREEFEECGHSLSLVVDIATSDIKLSDGGKVGLVELGLTSVRRFKAAVAKLSDYTEGNLPS
uniref:Uncharacterized protein n=1 Tax=viral metagenome TaxID=1070528 RepID=A0A6H1ZGA8_9ZZZZ